MATLDKKNKDIDTSTVLAEITEDSILDDILYHYTYVDKKSLLMVERGTKTKEIILKELDELLKARKVSDDIAHKIKEKFQKFIWGYYILEDCIDDEDISDIRIMYYDNIRIKRLGKRGDSGVKFKNEKDCKRFIDMVAVKNKVNVSDINALVNFTDKTSNDKFRLRFTLANEFVTSDEITYLHIRKIPKIKLRLNRLIELGMLTKEQADFLVEEVKSSKGIIFTGKGGSGKTTLMNALLEEIPHDKSGMVIQESDEMFSEEHPEMMFLHVVIANGENKIQYTLEDLAKKGLTFDLDYFVISEIKGAEAKYILNASNTDHKCWVGVHGTDTESAYDKLADYMKYATDYSKKECMYSLKTMATCIHLEDFKINEISKVIGWDEEKEKLIFKKIF